LGKPRQAEVVGAGQPARIGGHERRGVADLLVDLRFSAEDLLYVLAAPWESVIRTSSGPKSRHRSPGLLG